MIIWGGDRMPGSCTEAEASADDSCGGTATAGEDFGDNRVPPTQLSDGAAFNPSTDTWRMIPNIPVRQALSGQLHWDGTYMYVFAIAEDAPDFNNIGLFLYDPATDTWDEHGSLGLNAVHHIIEVDKQLLVSGYRVGADGLEQVPTILGTVDGGRTWTTIHEAQLEEGQGRGPMLMADWDGQILVTAEAVDGGQRYPEVLSIDKPASAVSFYRTPTGPAVPVLYNVGEHVTPFLGPVVLGVDDVITFSPYGEVTRGNPHDGWELLGESSQRKRAFGMSTIWADDQVIIWGGRGTWNGAGSVNTGLAMTIHPKPVG